MAKKTAKFFVAQKEASKVKSDIVLKYFKFWSKFMADQVRHQEKPTIGYIDLFSGPGKYEDGTPSTPLLVLEHAIGKEDLRKMLITFFNDVKRSYVNQLVENVAALDGLDLLAHTPMIRRGEVDDELTAFFKDVAHMVPTFSFIDPFGYKGLTLELVDALAKSWGCDMVLFFAFNRINAALRNPKVSQHVNALFGVNRAEASANLHKACGRTSARRW